MVASIVITNWQLVATMLDLCTVKGIHLQNDHKIRLRQPMKDTYMDFYAQFYKYDQHLSLDIDDDSASPDSLVLPPMLKQKTAT